MGRAKSSSSSSRVSRCFIFICILSLTCTLSKAKSLSTNPGAASLLQIDNDPLGDVDIYTTLSDKDRQHWGRLGSISLADKARALEALEVATAVEVRLVGFDGEGADAVRLKEADLWRYITALRRDPKFHVLRSEPHSFLRSNVLFHITKAPRTLTHAIWDAVRLELEKKEQSNNWYPGKVADTVAVDVVDDLIADEIRQRNGLLVPTIYVLNPPPQAGHYVYSYETRSHIQACGGSVFASNSERYIWVDLTSGPWTYGPVFEGEGGAGPKSIPKPEHYGPENWSKAFVADLVGMVADAAEHVFVPPMDRYPVPYTRLTEVHLIHIREGPSLEGTGLAGTQFGLQEIEKIVNTQLLLPQQSVRFIETSFSLSDCEYCMAAFGRALRTSTRPQEEGHSGKVFKGSLAAIAWEFLDSTELHHWLKVFQQNILTEISRIHGSFQTDRQPGTRVIPVYVFDQDTDSPAWLDRTQQAVAFDDMIVAVLGKGPWQPSGLQCNGQMAMLKPHSLPRSLLAALLQTVWGVAPSYETWSVFHNTTLHNWLWSVGRTPFGPFSDKAEVSFIQSTAAQRNVVLTLLNEAVEEARGMLRAVHSYGGEQVLLPPARHLEYSQRWGVLAHKLEKCAEALSLLKFPVALYYARSARHDLQRLQALLQKGAGELTTVLDCYEEPPFPFLGVGSTVALIGAAAYVYSKREQIFKNKKKQF